MRASALTFAILAACGPAVSTAPIDFDDDLGARAAAARTASANKADGPARPIAAPGAGTRTGAITRAQLTAVLDAGPAAFLSQIEVAPRLEGDKFIGWQLVQLVDHASALTALDIAPGDVLLAINGKPIARPDQLQDIWDSLRNATAVVATLWRGNAQFEIRFTIAPVGGGATGTPIADAL